MLKMFANLLCVINNILREIILEEFFEVNGLYLFGLNLFKNLVVGKQCFDQIFFF
jgi:hypothetical protein